MNHAVSDQGLGISTQTEVPPSNRQGQEQLSTSGPCLLALCTGREVAEIHQELAQKACRSGIFAARHCEPASGVFQGVKSRNSRQGLREFAQMQGFGEVLASQSAVAAPIQHLSTDVDRQILVTARPSPTCERAQRSSTTSSDSRWKICAVVGGGCGTANGMSERSHCAGRGALWGLFTI